MVTIDELLTADELWNPYDFANPVSADALFAGRESELADIRYYLRQAAKAPRPINLVLTGERSAGKTSLLNKIDHEARGRGLTVARVDLNEGDANPLAFFFKVYDSILLAAVTDGAFAGITGQCYQSYRRIVDTGDVKASCELLFPGHYAAASVGSRHLSEPTLRADLGRIAAELGRPLVVLFDECDVLAKSRIELEMLRNLFMNTAGYMLVFAGTPNLFPVMEDIFSPIIRQFKKVPVTRFSKQTDTTECIERPLRSLGIRPREIINDRTRRLYFDVHELSGGRPYEIQLLCHFMFRRIEDRRAKTMDITVDVLDDVRRELETQDRGSGRRSISSLRRLGPADLEHLRLLTDFRGTVEQLWKSAVVFHDFKEPLDVLARSAEHLKTLGLLKSVEDELVFAGDQFDEVYARYFAAAREVQLFITSWPLAEEARIRLMMALREVGGVRELALLDDDEAETRVRLSEALAALTGTGDSGSALPDMAVWPVYGLALGAAERGVLTIGLVKLTLADEQVATWVALVGGITEADVMTNAELATIASRAETVDGDLTATFFEYPVPPRESLLPTARRLASPAQLPHLADEHINLALARYNVQEYREGVVEAKTAMELVPSARAGTVAAHLSLLAGDPETARLAAIESLALAREAGDADDAAVAGYDLGAAKLLEGDTDGALEALGTAAADFSGDPEPFPTLVLVAHEEGRWRVIGDRSATVAEAAADLIQAIQTSG